MLFKDLDHGEIKLMPENLDDIWHLYNIIEEEDLVRAITFRTEEEKSDRIRSKKTQKKKMKLGLRVKEVTFHKFSDRLRVKGLIEEGPQELGSFHTFNVDADQMDKISIIKDEWKEHQLKRIKEAVHSSKVPLLTFVSMDEETATIAVLRQSGVQWITDISSNRSGKMYETKNTEKEYFGDIISVVKHNKDKNSTLVVVGPGFAKEQLVKYGKEHVPQIFENYVVHNTGSSGMNGVQEAIKRGIVKQITKENRVSKETELVEKFFEEIKKNGLAAYGIEEVKFALKNGAVDCLLITDKLVRSEKGEELIKIAKENKSDFTIINTMHEAGEKIEGIGGVGALLRFKVSY